MNALLALTLTLTQTWATTSPADTVYVGEATHYARNRMARVLVVRGIIADTALYGDWLSAHGYLGAAAVPKKGDLFRSVWINGRGPYFAADCRQLAHFPGKHVIEVDYETAMLWLEQGPWPKQVAVSFAPPPLGTQWR